MRYASLTLFIVSCLCAPAQAQTLMPEPPREISVTGQSQGISESDAAIVTLQLESQGQSAREAFAQTQARRETLLKSLNDSGLTSTMRLRGKELSGPNGAMVSAGTVVSLREVFSIELEKIADIDRIVDAGIAAGCKVVSIDYITRSDRSKNELILEATADAQQKANLVAKQLGVSLGEVLSVGITEEPQGALMLQARQNGARQLQGAQPASRVYASLRYAIARK